MTDGGTSERAQSQSIKSRLEAGTDDTVFRDKGLLNPDRVIDEDRIVGRDEQLDLIINSLQPILRGTRPPNLLLYGPSGTGKSLIINAVCQQIRSLATNQGEKFGVIDINCQTINTHDRAVYRLVESAADSAGVEPGVPETGVSTDHKLNRLYELLDDQFDSSIVILDEIDLLAGRTRDQSSEPGYSKLLYQLSRTAQLGQLERVSVVALTNDPRFMENLDGRTESSFNPEDISFTDYDANELRSILSSRRDAYRGGVLGDDVVPLSAAHAARDHGDARKAIDLFRMAGELADRRGDDAVREHHVREAQEAAARDRTLTQMRGLSVQKKLALYATAAVSVFDDRLASVPNSVSYEVYNFVTELVSVDQKSRDSFLRYLNECETYNFVVSETKGQGYAKGVVKNYSFVDDAKTVLETLESGLEMDELAEDRELVRSVVESEISEFLDG
jgi:cell division control protein 6